MDRYLSGALTLGKSGPESDDNEGVLYIFQIPKARTSPPDCLMSYPGSSLGEGPTPLQRCSQYILQLNPTGLPAM